MERRAGATRWGIELVAAIACVALVAQRVDVVHTSRWIQWIAMLAIAAALGAVALSAGARLTSPGAAPLALAAVLAGLASSDDGRVAVAGFAMSAVLPVVALAVASRDDIVPVAIVGSVTAAVVAARVLFRDPFRELHCEPYCDANPFLLDRHPDLVTAAEWLLVGTSAIAIGWFVVRCRRWDAATAAALAIAAAATLHLAVRPRPVPDAAVDVLFETFVFVAIAVFAWARSSTATTTWRARRELQRFGRTLATANDVAGIQSLLRRATGDPDLRVELPGCRSGGPDASSATTTVARDGRTVAVISHRIDQHQRVARAVTPTVALALETQQVLHEARELVDVVESSRARFARAADASRRRLERDLHDGAQQHLLVTGMALADAADRADESESERYRQAAMEVSGALGELRRIGRGDVATIAELGLEHAASAVGRGATRVLTSVEPCVDVTHECWPVAEATTAYRLLVSIVGAAEQVGPVVIRFSARCLGVGHGRSVVVSHDGSPRADHTLDRDRILAVGGTVHFSDSGPVVAEAWLP